MPRLVFIHGYIESPAIFDQLAPLVAVQEQLRLSLQDEFAHWNPDDRSVNASTLAAYLRDTYQISASDIVIGHSMGGWIAIHLKQLTGCTAILVSSFTDPQKVLTPVKNLTWLNWMVQSGLMQHKTLNNYLLKQYRRDESRNLYTTLIRRVPALPRRYLWQQFRILFAPTPLLTVQPDLRIHARRDNIVKYPDEPFSEVPGDHFSLVYHAQAMAGPISELFSSISVSARRPSDIL